MSRQPDISDPNRSSFSCRAGAKAESVNEIVEEFLGTRGGDGDHLVGQVSHKSAENVEMIRPATSSATPASLTVFRSATGVVWRVFGNRRDSFGRIERHTFGRRPSVRG